MAGMPRLAFLLTGEPGTEGHPFSADRSTARGFRQRVRDAGLIFRSFSSADGLELELFHALTELAGHHRISPRTVSPRVSLPPRPRLLAGRPELLARLTARLAAGPWPRTAALYGMALDKDSRIHSLLRNKDRPVRPLPCRTRAWTAPTDPAAAYASTSVRQSEVRPRLCSISLKETQCFPAQARRPATHS